MNQILSIEIFGRLLFEGDAVEFLGWCKDKKKEWILTHTDQKDVLLIKEFIDNPKISKDCKCHDCGKNKKVNDESNGISKEATATTEPVDNTKPDRKNSAERQKKPKGRKD